MHWLFPVSLQILFSQIANPVLIKSINSRESRSRALVWQYIFAFILATIIALVFGAQIWDFKVLAVIAIGIANGFACYCYWRAVSISLSTASIFGRLGNLTSFALGYIVLGEARFLNPLLVAGLVFYLATMAIYVLARKKTAQEEMHKTKAFKIGFGLWVAFYSIMWGITSFSMRLLSIKGMTIPSFLLAWYLGSLIGAFLVFALAGKKEAGPALNRKQVLQTALLAVGIVAALGAAYWAQSLAPITVIQPIIQVGEMIFPVAIGLWIFKEVKKLNFWTGLAMVLGIVAGIFVALSQ